MTPVLARLLNCSGVEEMKDERGHLFQEYFQEFQVETEPNSFTENILRIKLWYYNDIRRKDSAKTINHNVFKNVKN